MPDQDLLDLPADQKNLLRLARNGVLDVRSYERALKIIGYTPGSSGWNRFLNVVMLVLGAGFTVSGIYFFFAYNWAGMHRFVKLGIVQALIILAVFAASRLGLDKLPGKIVLTAAGLLIGALLAVFGQVYQTGADAYQLFLGWGVFMVGWVLISRFTPMWFIWVLLLNTALVLYWVQIVGFSYTIYLPLFALNALFVLAWETGLVRRIDWLTSRWPPRLLALIVFYALTVPVVLLIVGEDSEPVLILMAILFVMIHPLVIYIYSQEIPDPFMLTLSAVSMMVAINTWIASAIDLGDFTTLCIGVLIIGQVALVVTWILRLARLRGVQGK